MKHDTNKRLWPGFFGLALALGIGACSGTTTVDAHGEIGPLKGGFTISHHSDPSGGTATIKGIPDGKRADIRFYDAHGNEIPGSAVTGAGNGQPFPVPAGTASAVWSGPSSASSCTGCIQNLRSPSGSVNTTNLGIPVNSPLEYFIGGEPVSPETDPDAATYGPLANTMFLFRIQAGPGLSASQLFGMVANIVMADPLDPPRVPRNVEIEQLVKIIPNTFGLGAKVYTCDVSRQPFQSFEMDWNGAFFADLSVNSTVFDLPHGWRVIEVPLSLSDFNLIGNNGSDNHLSIWSKTMEDPGKMHLDGTGLLQ